MQRKGVLPGKIFAPCVPERRFAGLFGCMARISCQNQLISDAWRANLAANWRFSSPRPLLGCMKRKTCHGLPPGNAFREYIATASQAKSASGRNPAIVERLGNASCEHFAIVERPGNAYSRRPAHGDDTLSRWPATERKVGARCPAHGGVR